jgi:hypothetical protein
MPVTLDGGGAVRIFNIAPTSGTPAVTIRAISVLNGYVQDVSGGGLLIGNAAVTLENCTVSGNVVKGITATFDIFGGGIFVASSSGSLAVSGGSITGNRISAAACNGGGIASDGAVTLSNCTVSGNQASQGFGGGVVIRASGSLSATNCKILDNGEGDATTPVNYKRAFAGGGVFSRGPTTITACTVSGNEADFGGGVQVNDLTSSLTMTGTVVSGNTVIFDGAGVRVFNSTPVFIMDSTISTNTASVGGGLEFRGSANPVIQNCTISGNTANGASSKSPYNYGQGGGVHFVASGTLTVNNSTIADNTATDSATPAKSAGGGIFRQSGSSVNLTSTLVATNTVATNGSGPDISGAATANYSLIGKLGGATITGNNNMLPTGSDTLDPMLGKLAPNGGLTLSHGFLAGSPAINKGTARVTEIDITINATETVITVESGTPLLSGMLVQIDSEIIKINSVSGNVASVARGQQGTTAASHAVDTPVALAYDQRGVTFRRTAPSGVVTSADIGAFEQALARVGSVRTYFGTVPGTSMVNIIRVTFDQAVTFPSGVNAAFKLSRVGQPTGGPSATAKLGDVNFSATASGSVATITVAGGGTVPLETSGSLIDGKYQLTVVAANVATNTGKLDGNGDGSDGDDYVSPSSGLDYVRRLFGDQDDDGDVDAADFGAFRAAFGTANPDFDFDIDADVDASDFGQFRGRFGVSV